MEQYETQILPLFQDPTYRTRSRAGSPPFWHGLLSGSPVALPWDLLGWGQLGWTRTLGSCQGFQWSRLQYSFPHFRHLGIEAQGIKKSVCGDVGEEGGLCLQACGPFWFRGSLSEPGLRCRDAE